MISNCHLSLNQQETATVLAGLRHWQSNVEQEERGAYPQFYIDGVRPLDNKEIDQLCENINCYWENNYLQFARLLAELKASGIHSDTLADLKASMDLETEDIWEILDRAEEVFESYKV